MACRCSRTTPLPLAWERAITLAAHYLAALWQVPCYDCWEERGGDIHISTLAAIYAGLGASARLVPSLNWDETLHAIRHFVLAHGLTPGGELAKSVGLDMVDANLIGVAVPHRLLEPDDPVMRRTIARIERDLHAARSGIHRHVEDVYYGGGAWVLLALWLAWYYFEVGERQRAEDLIAWAEDQADEVTRPSRSRTRCYVRWHYDDCPPRADRSHCQVTRSTSRAGWACIGGRSHTALSRAPQPSRMEKQARFEPPVLSLSRSQPPLREPTAIRLPHRSTTAQTPPGALHPPRRAPATRAGLQGVDRPPVASCSMPWPPPRDSHAVIQRLHQRHDRAAGRPRPAAAMARALSDRSTACRWSPALGHARHDLEWPSLRPSARCR